MLEVSKLPRAPFLRHSGLLFRHLLSSQDGFRPPSSVAKVLEIGCGARSPMVGMLHTFCPEGELHQIDARAEVIAPARLHNPSGIVEQMRAAEMSKIPSTSKDLIIAMSVFDQNPARAMSSMAKEMCRVLNEHGLVLYIHNEELNVPATSASFASEEPTRYFIPNDRWKPSNDLEYCSGEATELAVAIKRLGAAGSPLLQYIDAFHNTHRQRFSDAGRRTVPMVKGLTVSKMHGLRECVRLLRDLGVQLEDHSTAEIVKHRMESDLLSRANGFEVIESGVYEIQFSLPWHLFFADAPKASHFVRGLTKFGYASNTRPHPHPSCVQSLNRIPRVGDGEVALIAYQYGVVARKTAQKEYP